MNNYKIEKFNEYYQNVKFKKLLIDFLPLIIIKIIFPLIGSMGIKKNTYVLDIGSGNGLYSYILYKKFNCKVLEIEPNLDNVFYKSNRVNDDFLTFHTKKKFDNILLIDVLEHINNQDLNKVFKKLKSLMHKNTNLIIKVPNAGSFFGIESSFGDTTHVNHFSHISLSALLRINQFDVIKLCAVKDNFKFQRFITRLLSFPLYILFVLFMHSRGLGSYWSESAILGIFKLSTKS
jgi:SAM-dependent methyltransferase